MAGRRSLLAPGRATARHPLGPDRAAEASAGGPGFLVHATDCAGLHADQFDLAGEMWAVVPASRGSVEVTSRNHDGVVAFRNELWNAETGYGRTRLDLAAWDPPRPAPGDGSGPLRAERPDPGPRPLHLGVEVGQRAAVVDHKGSALAAGPPGET